MAISQETYKAYEQAMLYFLTQDPFHGYILAQMQLQEVDERTPEALMPVAGVAPVGTQIYLYLRKGAFASLPPRQRVFVLRHEVMHVVDKHFSRRVDRNPRLWNEAADLAINSMIERVSGSEMPQWVLHPRTYGPVIGVRLPDHESAEVYYEILKKSGRAGIAFVQEDGTIGYGDAGGDSSGGKPGSDQSSNDGSGSGSASGRDLHPFWQDAAGQSSSLTDAAVRRVVSEAYQKYGNRLAGLYPLEYVRVIKELLEPEIDWRRYASLFVGSVLSNLRHPTWLRPNRREIPYIRGSKRQLRARIVVGLDTSGSISDDELTRFVSELRGILRTYETEFYVVPCDAVAYDPVEVGSLTDINKLIRQIKGGGGTLFMPVIEKARELRADGIIYFTDGYNADKLPEEEPIRTLWILTEDGREPVSWGQKARFKRQKKGDWA